MTSDSPKAKATQRGNLSRNRAGLDAGDVLAFLIPFLRFVQFKLIGVLSGSDALCLILFAYLLVRGRVMIQPKQGKWLIALCSLWLVGQFVTDLVRHTTFTDYARGWSNIGTTAAIFAVLFTLVYGRVRRLMFYGWGLVTGSLLEFLISPDSLMKIDSWKFGYSLPVTLALLLLASTKSCPRAAKAILCVFAGLLNMALGVRAAGGFCLAVVFYMILMRWMQRKSAEGVRVRAGTVTAIAASLALSIAGILWFYQYAARTGILGENAEMKYESQSSGKYGLLFGGRTEMFSSIPAIYDSPILGHGSWAKDPIYLFIQQRTLAELGYDFAGEMSASAFDEPVIPTHSYIFGAWVDAGILGAVFWIFVFVISAKALLRSYPPNLSLLPLAAYTGFGLLWDLLFSPYGAEMRIITPFYVVLLMSCSNLVPHGIAPVTQAVRKAKASISPIARPATS